MSPTPSGTRRDMPRSPLSEGESVPFGAARNPDGLPALDPAAMASGEAVLPPQLPTDTIGKPTVGIDASPVESPTIVYDISADDLTPAINPLIYTPTEEFFTDDNDSAHEAEQPPVIPESRPISHGVMTQPPTTAATTQSANSEAQNRMETMIATLAEQQVVMSRALLSLTAAQHHAAQNTPTVTIPEP